MKLNYWIKAHKKDDSQTLRARTKGEVEIAFAKGEGAGTYNPDDFAAAHKVTVVYKDGYDLMTQLRAGTLAEAPLVNLAKASVKDLQEAHVAGVANATGDGAKAAA